jgi:uroporphyrinogen decarboxylase
MEPSISPRERVRLALDHRQPDRPPVLAWMTPEAWAAVCDYLARAEGSPDPGPIDLAQVLEIDFRYVQPLSLTPGPAAAAIDPPLPDGIYQDVRERPLAWIRTLEDVQRYQPDYDPDAFDFTGLASAAEQAGDYAIVFGSPGVFDLVNGLGARGLGLEDLFCGILTGDPVVGALVDKRLEYHYEFCRRGLEAGGGRIDILHIGEDCGNQRSTHFSPEFFRRFFAPRLRRFADLAHRHGARCMLHSCGSNWSLYPILIEEVGIDIHDSCQPEPVDMDPVRLKRAYGDRITFCGLLSLQRTLSKGTPDDCRREAAFLVDEMGRDGGYIFAPANTITRDARPENILAAYEVVLRKPLLAR